MRPPYRDEGLRVIDMAMVTVDGQTRYAGVWVKNKEDRKWLSRRDLTDEQFSSEFTKYVADGYRPIDIETYATADGIRNGVVWVENKDAVVWQAWRDMDSAALDEKFQKLNEDGMRMIDVESYQRGGQQQYAGI